MIIGSMKCKICGKKIEPPEIVIREDPAAHDGRIIGKLLNHLRKRAEFERKSPHGGPHLQAIQQAAATCMNISSNLNGALLTGNFELPEGLENQRQSLLRQVHEMTRTVRTSDLEIPLLIERAFSQWGGDFPGNNAVPYLLAIDRLEDLRDRYEALGKYAPVVQEVEVLKQ